MSILAAVDDAVLTPSLLSSDEIDLLTEQSVEPMSNPDGTG
jgi:hypothetical protein